MKFLQNLSLDEAKPIYQQIYEYLRGAILAGQVETGNQLPSTRALADLLGVSRNTILSAYDQLMAEGYLENRRGKGTFVTTVLPETFFAPEKENHRQSSTRSHQLSQRAQRLSSAPAMAPPDSNKRTGQAFQTGSPALDAFPYELWAKLISRHANRLYPDAMMYQDLAGYRPLREAIADHVMVARQIPCTSDQIILVPGSQGGLHLATCALLNPGDEAWIEDPGYLGARGALLTAGAKLVPVPVDSEGMRIDAGIARAPHARLAYITPSHQFPLGVVMSLRRRLQLLEWAKRNNSYILEDDYDSEYRFTGRPLAALYGIDESQSVIYIGTFSKVLFPALRLGYLILPPPLVDAFLALRRAMDYHLPVLEQVALADFIAEGHCTRHIRRMRTLYAERRGMLVEALDGLPLEIEPPETGMYLVGWLPDGVRDTDTAQAASRHQVRVLPVSRFAIETLLRAGLMLGYASIDQPEIQRGAERLAKALAHI